MKKIFIAFLCIVSLTYTSCSDDEENTSIIGTWAYTEGVEGDAKNETLTFNDDGSFVRVITETNNGQNNTQVLEGTYEIEDDMITARTVLGGNTSVSNGTYHISDNILTLTWDFGQEPIEYARQ